MNWNQKTLEKEHKHNLDPKTIIRKKHNENVMKSSKKLFMLTPTLAYSKTHNANIYTQSLVHPVPIISRQDQRLALLRPWHHPSQQYFPSTQMGNRNQSSGLEHTRSFQSHKRLQKMLIRLSTACTSVRQSVSLVQDLHRFRVQRQCVRGRRRARLLLRHLQISTAFIFMLLRTAQTVLDRFFHGTGSRLIRPVVAAGVGVVVPGAETMRVATCGRFVWRLFFSFVSRFETLLCVLCALVAKL